MSLLISSLPAKYLTFDLLSSFERLASGVLSDRVIYDEVQKLLIYNFRIWVNASVDIQVRCPFFEGMPKRYFYIV